MIAILLAAGVGNRLGDFTRNQHKALLPIGEQTLLARSLAALAKARIDRVAVTVGHCAEQVRSALAAAPLTCETVYNPDYREGSILSLWHARHYLGGDDVLIMDADVLYPQLLLERLVGSPHPSCSLLDGRVEGSGEEMILCTSRGRVWDIVRRKPGQALQPPAGVADYDRAGESVGFLKLSRHDAGMLAEILDRRVAAGARDEEYEASFPELFARCQVGYERVDDLPWTEIDFPADVERARTQIMPAIAALEAGPK